MPVIREVKLTDDSTRRIHALAYDILRVCRGKSKVEIEQALLAAYTSVADGVQAMPESTRPLRARLVAQRGARALCEAITEIGALDDAAVYLVARTCQE